jgi:hypothetical protein
MEFQMDTSNGYRVEVSGWDTKETFFVEKTILEWEGEGKKEIALKSPLREGCVVFVRLLQPVASGNNFPIAYQARTIASQDANGRARVGLERLRPRASCKDTIELSVKTTIKVA